ncbi:MBL fold metallo-hydrolase [Paenibacillus sp. IHBB 10380]|uniref:MBL fold metallo-hydrolase n=1 Tax=Paenibacillus sp. IHBB 10380 TaxID=1566358 RepID=UPI0005CFC7EF|nr:MBL fold metallo-hydrolase [Paenibacillus sp. IHBB 10380]
MPEMITWDYGINQVKISMSYPLRWVNSYVLQDSSGGVAIIDPGPRNSITEKEWEKALEYLGYTLHDVSEVFVTHHHPDHYGLAGWFQSQSDCLVYMSQRAYDESLMMWGEDSVINTELMLWLRQHGLPEKWTGQMEQHLLDFLPQVSPAPDITIVKGESHLELGGLSWLVIETGGHAPGHLSLYNRDFGLMMCGDAVLPQISPNVSLIPGSDPEPLNTFMNSLLKFNNVEVKQAFPGHRNPFSTFHKRIEDLLAHHEQRLLEIEKLLIQSPQSGYEICATLFGNRLSLHQMRFAMCEALAHLQELVRRDKAQSSSTLNGGIIFTATNKPLGSL